MRTDSDPQSGVSRSSGSLQADGGGGLAHEGGKNQGGRIACQDVGLSILGSVSAATFGREHGGDTFKSGIQHRADKEVQECESGLDLGCPSISRRTKGSRVEDRLD